ncbi:hypothetical protein RFI_05425 [Reticulomyxa filosa]|uniref:Uncharacterized protein n=1 Tax=Reticulomyxa filosa TaxID=46433 RepID=X6NZF6_RETFI|nr:hypothetical protein RFI_05425 [Reticulomyxa filosa]|eukprot:ETO31695.1 hypothetical protein RFI_05425 [Reticulomyxa filosa]
MDLQASHLLLVGICSLLCAVTMALKLDLFYTPLKGFLDGHYEANSFVLNFLKQFAKKQYRIRTNVRYKKEKMQNNNNIKKDNNDQDIISSLKFLNSKFFKKLYYINFKKKCMYKILVIT